MVREIIELQRRIDRDGPITDKSTWLFDLFRKDIYIKANMNEMEGNFQVHLTFAMSGDSIVKVRQTISYSVYSLSSGGRRRAHDIAFALTHENLKTVFHAKPSPRKLGPTGLTFGFYQPLTVRRHAEWPFTFQDSQIQDFDIDLPAVTLWFPSVDTADYASDCFEYRWPKQFPSLTAAPDILSNFNPPRFEDIPLHPTAAGSIQR